jgi:hypothetical protein
MGKVYKISGDLSLGFLYTYVICNQALVGSLLVCDLRHFQENLT